LQAVEGRSSFGRFETTSNGQIHEKYRHPCWLRWQHSRSPHHPNRRINHHSFLASSRNFKDSEGNRQSETEWRRITCFNGVGKCVAEHVAKEPMIMVTGRVHYTKWTDQNGTDRYGCEIIAEQVDFLAKAKEATNSEPKKRRSK
jgi:single-strand DNA-binding protein